MGLFQDIDLQNAEDNPWHKPDGTYTCVVASVTLEQNKDKTKTMMVITYRIAEFPEKPILKGQDIKEWKWVPTRPDLENDSDGKAAMSLSFLKNRIKDFGIPEDRLNDFEPDDIMGLKVKVVGQNKNDNFNVRSVSLFDGDDADPFA